MPQASIIQNFVIMINDTKKMLNSIQALWHILLQLYEIKKHPMLLVMDIKWDLTA